jgi:hypothetical protein
MNGSMVFVVKARDEDKGKGKGKGKVHPKQDTKTQRRSRIIALLFP